MPNRNLEIEESKSLLDVVFGVVIAFTLYEFPLQAWWLLNAPSYERATHVLLMLAALIFASFYWIETRFFIKSQIAFEDAIKLNEGARTDGVRLPIAIFLLGTLLMMAIASGVLIASVKGSFRPFLIASLLFWATELAGTFILKKAYKPLAVSVAGATNQESKDWFQLHIMSRFFYAYAFFSIVAFGLALYLNHFGHDSQPWQFWIAVGILATTLLRHLVLRSYIADLWLAKLKARSRDSKMAIE